MTTIRPSGRYARYRGGEYPVGASGKNADGSGYAGLLIDVAARADFAAVFERASGGLLAMVPRDELERYEDVTTTATYDGQKVTMWGSGPTVPCTFVGDPRWADEHGFTGSQHDGWTGDVPRDELHDIHETVTELP